MLEAQNNEKFNKSAFPFPSPIVLCLTLFLSPLACETAIAPPDLVAGATIRGTVSYSGPWPSADSVRDLRFVALRFVPVDTTDFLQLNRMEISDELAYGVAVDSFEITDIVPGVFPFSGIARQITSNIFSWAPIGLYELNSGVLELAPGEEVDLNIAVDFSDIPQFPKQGRDIDTFHYNSRVRQ